MWPPWGRSPDNEIFSAQLITGKSSEQNIDECLGTIWPRNILANIFKLKYHFRRSNFNSYIIIIVAVASEECFRYSKDNIALTQVAVLQ